MKRLIAGLLLITFTGCSFVYTEHDIAGDKGEFATFDLRLIGDWECAPRDGQPPTVYPEPKIGEFFRVERKSPEGTAVTIRSFSLIRSSDGGPAIEREIEGGPISANLVKLNDRHYLSLQKTSKSPGHLIVRLEWNQQDLGIALMEPRFFEKHPQLTPHRTEESHNHTLLTGSVAELHSFLKSHGERVELWEWMKTAPVLRKRELPAKTAF